MTKNLLQKTLSDTLLQCEALRAIETYGYSPQIDSTLVRLGLESVTSLHTTFSVSQEGVVGWINDKAKIVLHKLHIFVNETYAKFTKADKDIHEAIAEAKKLGPDHTIEVPITKTGMLIATATIAAATAALVVITKNLKSGNKDIPVTEVPKAVGTKEIDPQAYVDEVSKVSKDCKDAFSEAHKAAVSADLSDKGKLKDFLEQTGKVTTTVQKAVKEVQKTPGAIKKTKQRTKRTTVPLDQLKTELEKR